MRNDSSTTAVASPRGGLGWWTCPPHFRQKSFPRLMQTRRVSKGFSASGGGFALGPNEGFTPSTQLYARSTYSSCVSTWRCTCTTVVSQAKVTTCSGARDWKTPDAVKPKFHSTRSTCQTHALIGCVELVQQHGSTRSICRTCRVVSIRDEPSGICAIPGTLCDHI